MFKRLLILFTLLAFSGVAKAADIAGINVNLNVGVSATAGYFEGSAKEVESTEESGNKSAEALFAMGSGFLEIEANDKFAIGLDYVAHDLESEATNHKQDDLKGADDGASSTVDNNVQVDFENYTTLYAKLNIINGLYLKAGYSEVKAVTNESLGTGSEYGNKTLNGYMAGIGYNHDLDSGVFFRVEGNVTQIEGATFNSTTNTDNKVVVDDIDGYSARISVGKTF